MTIPPPGSDELASIAFRSFLQCPLAKVVDWRTTVIAAVVAWDELCGIGVTLSIGVGTRSVGHDKPSASTLPVLPRDGDAAIQRDQEQAATRLFTLVDGHAEVMARRGLMAFFLDEGAELLKALEEQHSLSFDDEQLHNRPTHVSILEVTPTVAPGTATTDLWTRETPQRRMLRLRKHVSLHMVVSQCPCGAMSVTPSLPLLSTGAHVLLSTGGTPEQSSHPALCRLKRTEHTVVSGDHVLATIADRELHVVRNVGRTKPGAGTPSLSMSCSDKLTKWMRRGRGCGVLGGCLSAVFETAVLDTLCIGSPSSEWIQKRVDGNDARAGNERMKELRTMWMSEASVSISSFLQARGVIDDQSIVNGQDTVSPRCCHPRWSWFDAGATWKRVAAEMATTPQALCGSDGGATVSAACWRSTSSATGASQRVSRKRLRDGDSAEPFHSEGAHHERAAMNVLAGYCWSEGRINTRDGRPFGLAATKYAKALNQLTAECGAAALASATTRDGGVSERLTKDEVRVAECVLDEISIAGRPLGGGGSLTRWAMGIATARLCLMLRGVPWWVPDGVVMGQPNTFAAESGSGAGGVKKAETLRGVATPVHPYHFFKRRSHNNISSTAASEGDVSGSRNSPDSAHGEELVLWVRKHSPDFSICQWMHSELNGEL